MATEEGCGCGGKGGGGGNGGGYEQYTLPACELQMPNIHSIPYVPFVVVLLYVMLQLYGNQIPLLVTLT